MKTGIKKKFKKGKTKPFKLPYLKQVSTFPVSILGALLFIAQFCPASSEISAIHKIQDERLKGRMEYSEEIKQKTLVLSNLQNELEDYLKTKKELNSQQKQLIKALHLGKHDKAKNIVDKSITTQNANVLYHFILNDYPIDKSARLKTIKKLVTKAQENELNSSAVEEFYTILDDEINLSYKDNVKTEEIEINNELIEVLSFNVGRVGYYFINESLGLAGLFSLADSKWKLIEYNLYADKFKNAIKIIENNLPMTYVLLPIEIKVRPDDY